MSRLVVLALALALPACQFTPGAALPADGPGGDDDGGPPDGAPPPADHLLISELEVTGPFEFIELYNPGPDAVDLSEYYLSDIDNYWELPSGIADVHVAQFDFLIQFPAGATLAADTVAVVAFDGAGFRDEYDVDPDYFVFTAAGSAQVMIDTSGTAPNPMLTDTGELVALFRWDGEADLVEDVDLVVHGTNPSSINFNTPIQKEAVDGPDAGDAASSYAVDALSYTAMRADFSGKKSYKRLLPDAGHEVATGGNGLGGHDETTEDFAVTWDDADSNGEPGAVAAALRPM